MDLVRNIAVAALLFLIFIVLTSGRGFGATNEEQAPKRIQTEDARKAAEIERIRVAQARRRELERLCRVKPVMSDGEIASCRVAYRDLSGPSK